MQQPSLKNTFEPRGVHPLFPEGQRFKGRVSRYGDRGGAIAPVVLSAHSGGIWQNLLGDNPQERSWGRLLQMSWETLTGGGAVPAEWSEYLAIFDPSWLALLRQWVGRVSPELNSLEALKLAAVLVNLGEAIGESAIGDRGENTETAIACCELALDVLKCDRFPQARAPIHNNLALMYSERLGGDRLTNLSRAFSHYERAAQVSRRQPFPETWESVPLVWSEPDTRLNSRSRFPIEAIAC
jgi:hypothetical protein